MLNIAQNPQESLFRCRVRTKPMFGAYSQNLPFFYKSGKFWKSIISLKEILYADLANAAKKLYQLML